MKYNKGINSPRTLTENLAGGEAYSQDPRMELISLMATSFLKDQFYRSQAETCKRIDELIELTGPLYAAKAAILTRYEYGNRSVTHYVAARIAHILEKKGLPWRRSFFERVVRRADDVLEILACYRHLYPSTGLPNALKRGLGDVLSDMGEYELAKYARKGSDFKMVDAINLLHPKSTDPLAALINGTLEPPETWEVKITQAGGDQEKKKSEWRALLLENKLGYMALLRNIRNIMDACPDLVDTLCEQLVNQEAIRKSLVFPFQFLVAINVLSRDLAGKDGTRAQKVIQALSKAVDLSLPNVPTFEGSTLVALDVSGSMCCENSTGASPAQIGSLFAAVMLKRQEDCDLITFDDKAFYRMPDLNDSTLTIARHIDFRGGGTDFRTIFTVIRKYDQIIILSDMQAWVGYYSPKNELAAYRSNFNPKVKIFSFDLQGYGSVQFPEPGVYQLAGFSDESFKIMESLRKDHLALVKSVEAVQL
jgi:60 kDa SS-A/Ro ribonucleoprotein